MSSNEDKPKNEKLKVERERLQCLLDYQLPGYGMDDGDIYVPRLLDRLRELGIIQICERLDCVFFYPVHNTRPLLMYQVGRGEFPQYERLFPIYVYETVNSLMWEGFLEPELALAYKGLFDWTHIPGFALIQSHDPSDAVVEYFNQLI
jgi:hypothetical protein